MAITQGGTIAYGNNVVTGGGSGGGSGHTILNDAGTPLAQEDDLQFVGTYVSDDSTNSKTVVPIIRSMQQAEFDQLSSDEKKGLIDVTDAGYTPGSNTRILDLSDVAVVMPVNGQILKYDSTTNKWVNASEVSVPEIVDDLTTDDATKTLSAAQGKALNDKITTANTNISNINSATVVSSVTLNVTISGTNYPVSFYKYSNGMKECRIYQPNWPTSNIITDSGFIPEAYRPSDNTFCAGMNGQYNSTSTGINKSRFIAVTPDGKLYIYGSPYAGLWVNLFYCN